MDYIEQKATGAWDAICKGADDLWNKNPTVFNMRAACNQASVVAKKTAQLGAKIIGRAAVVIPVLVTAATGNIALPFAFAVRMILPDDCTLVNALWTNRGSWERVAIGVALFVLAVPFPLYLGMSPFFVMSSGCAFLGVATAQAMISGDADGNLEFNKEDFDWQSEKLQKVAKRIIAAVAVTLAPFTFSLGFAAPFFLDSDDTDYFRDKINEFYEKFESQNGYVQVIAGALGVVGVAGVAYINSTLAAIIFGGTYVLGTGAYVGAKISDSEVLEVRPNQHYPWV